MPIQLPEHSDCPFCRYLSREDPCVFVAENPMAAAIVNRTQYERGSMLVVPREHRQTILEIGDSELASVYWLVKQVAKAAVSSLGAVGVNVFQNNGKVAGQHVRHFHVHVVPRYPTSVPGKVFDQNAFPISSFEEQQAVADAICAAL